MCDLRLVVEVKLAPKLVYGVSDPRYHPLENFRDGYELGKTAFLEGYLRGDIGVCLKLRCWFGKSDFEEYCAVFSDLNAVWHAEADDLWQNYASVSDADIAAHFGNGRDDDEELVFVYVVEFANGSEDSVVRRRSTARLYPADDFLSGNANVLYCSLLTGAFEFARFGVNGEVVPYLNRVVGPNYQTGEQMIKAGCQMMDNLTCENGKPIRRGTPGLRYKNVIESVVLKFSGNGIRCWTRTEEGSNFSVEILDALVGPLNFRSTPAQKARHDQSTTQIQRTT